MDWLKKQTPSLVILGFMGHGYKQKLVSDDWVTCPTPSIFWFYWAVDTEWSRDRLASKPFGEKTRTKSAVRLR